MSDHKVHAVTSRFTSVEVLRTCDSTIVRHREVEIFLKICVPEFQYVLFSLFLDIPYHCSNIFKRVPTSLSVEGNVFENETLECGVGEA